MSWYLREETSSGYKKFVDKYGNNRYLDPKGHFTNRNAWSGTLAHDNTVIDRGLGDKEIGQYELNFYTVDKTPDLKSYYRALDMGYKIRPNFSFKSILENPNSPFDFDLRNLEEYLIDRYKELMVRTDFQGLYISMEYDIVKGDTIIPSVWNSPIYSVTEENFFWLEGAKSFNSLWNNLLKAFDMYDDVRIKKISGNYRSDDLEL